MPDRYHVHTVPTPAQFHRVGKFGNVDWREDCSRCTNCVKLRCLYEVYRHEFVYNRDPLTRVDTLDECKACLSCVQGCTKGLLSVGVNPEFLDMGDEYWRPDMLASAWNQADAGRIPVSGAGYRGRFHGPGFDSIWTDMSEIVRPTRDGIHGREYISTSVDIGPKPLRLEFTADGKMVTEPARLIEIQIPAILDRPAWAAGGLELAQARTAAARELKSLSVAGAEEAAAMPAELRASTIPVVRAGDAARIGELLAAVKMAEVEDGAGALEVAAEIRAVNPGVTMAVRLPLRPEAAERALALAAAGLKVFHLEADQHGCEKLSDGRAGRHIKDALRELHGRLVKEGIRDEVTLVISGGIAAAEHMAKAIICGADLVAVDTALLVSLGCRVCRDPGECRDCPAEIGAAKGAYARQRMVNLMGAWHSQLIEVLGAMGIREVRRLRGEVGRAIFMEDIEREAFGDLDRAPLAEVGA